VPFAHLPKKAGTGKPRGPAPHEAVAEVEDAVAALLEAAAAIGHPVPGPSLRAARA